MRHKLTRIDDNTYGYRGFALRKNPVVSNTARRWSCFIDGVTMHRTSRRHLVKWIDARLDLK